MHCCLWRKEQFEHNPKSESTFQVFQTTKQTYGPFCTANRAYLIALSFIAKKGCVLSKSSPAMAEESKPSLLTPVPGAEGLFEALVPQDSSNHDKVFTFICKNCKSKELKAKADDFESKYKDGDLPPCVYLRRMAAFTLTKGGLLIYSPVECSDDLKAAVEEKGGCKVLVLPNAEHAIHFQGWVDAFPEAIVICPGGDPMADTIKELGDKAKVCDFKTPSKWSKDAVKALMGVGCEVVETSGYQEMILFHRKSKTLLASDFIYLGCSDKQDSAGWKNLTAPEWKELYFDAYCEKSSSLLPVYRTFLTPDQQKPVAKVLKKLVSWKPDRILSSHTGKVSDGGAAEALKILNGHWGWCGE